MRIGILAFSSCTNYGGMLQVYALQEMLAQMGHNPIVLDLWVIPNNKYLYGALHNPYAGTGTRLKALKKWLLNKRYRFYEQRYVAFQTWQRLNLKMSSQRWKTAKDFADNPPQCDLIEVGSDQVFNKDVAPIFLCTDVPLSLPRISYGASFGNMLKTEEECQRLKVGLSKFKGLSAREKAGVDLIQSILGESIPWVVDPVLLIGREFWQQIADAHKTNWQGLTIYWLGAIEPLREQIEQLRKRYKKPIKLFIAHYEERLPLNLEGVEIQWASDPFEFIVAIAQAEYVVSNSFHAMMFSILFGKRAAFIIGGHGRVGSATRFTDIATIVKCEPALYMEWPKDGIEFFDFSQCYDACYEMILSSRTVLEKLCDV